MAAHTLLETVAESRSPPQGLDRVRLLAELDRATTDSDTAPADAPPAAEANDADAPPADAATSASGNGSAADNAAESDDSSGDTNTSDTDSEVDITRLADRLDAESPTVYRALQPLCERDLVTDQRTVTRAGQLFCGRYGRTARRLGDDNVRWFAAAPSRQLVLERIATTARRKAGLDGMIEPSFSTINRTIEDAEEVGWAERVDGGYTLTRAGKEALGRYVRLARDVTALIQAAPALRGLVSWAIPPVPALPRTRLVERDSAQMTIADGHANAFFAGPLARVQVAATRFSRALFAAFHTTLVGEPTVELLFDRPAFRRLTQTQNHDALAALLTADTTQLRVVDTHLRTTLALYGETVVVDSHAPAGEAVLAGEDRRLQEWAVETFDDWWAAGSPPNCPLAAQLTAGP